MSEHRALRLSEELKQHAANFLEQESNRQSLITVTSSVLSPDLKRVTIFVSVFPETQEATAIAFANRNRPNFRDYLKSHARLRFIPKITFELDQGEKNRQRIDTLLNKDK